MKRVLSVWWNQRIVGELGQTEGGDLSFKYSTAWLADATLPAISNSLPKQERAFSRVRTRPFFEGLLPEGDPRRAAAEALGISPRNDFALLDRLGGDVAGALQFLRSTEVPLPMAGPFEPQVLSNVELWKMVEELPRRPLLAGREGMRLSLAGAQTKVPVVLMEGKIALPAEGQPSTHILKPAIPRFPGSTENEALVMRLAHAAGLETALVEPRVLEGAKGRRTGILLVERYDRSLENGVVRRLHQEDFCQALGVLVQRKYQSEGGPSFRDALNLVRQVSTLPGQDALRLLRATIFNVLVGNADAHGKNFSLVHGEHGWRLAPLYDLLSTVAYPELSPRFAMAIGTASTLEEMTTQTWRAFAQSAELGLPLVRRSVRELAESVREALPEVVKPLPALGLDLAVLSNLQKRIDQRASRLSQTVSK